MKVSRPIRVHEGLAIETPLILPSFSSKGYPRGTDGSLQLSREAAAVMPLINGGLLISAYDMHYGLLPSLRALEEYPAGPPYDSAEVLFIDSGGYEHDPRVDLSSVVSLTTQPDEWSEELLEESVRKLGSGLPVVLVNLDGPGRSIGEQIDSATQFHVRHDDFGADCLLKPSAGQFVDISEIAAAAEMLEPFDVIGVTEQELGPNIHSRLTSLSRLRRVLDHAGIASPVHVFGSLDPVLSAMYLIAGADVFDGLTWLRYALGDVPIHPDTHTALKRQLTEDQSERRFRMLGENLTAVAGLQARMRLFRSSGDFGSLRLDSSLVKDVVAIVAAA